MRIRSLTEALWWAVSGIVMGSWISTFMVVSFDLPWQLNAMPLAPCIFAGTVVVILAAKKKSLVPRDEPQVTRSECLGVLAMAIIVIAMATFFWWPEHQTRVLQLAIILMPATWFMVSEIIAGYLNASSCRLETA